jgi:hypothetical protein
MTGMDRENASPRAPLETLTKDRGGQESSQQWIMEAPEVLK